MIPVYFAQISFFVHFQIYSGIFLGLIWGQMSTPSQFKNEQKLSKIVYSITNFLVKISWKSKQK